jgi:adenosylcobinamide-GDP ribazoletransferase
VVFIEGFRACISFLTTIPVCKGRQDIDLAAAYMPSFPIIGAMIGFASGMLVWALDSLLPSLIVGMLGLGFILLLTGVHHTDGLLDFGDAVMYRGSPQEKMHVMRDQQTGAGGLSLGLVVLSATAFGIAALDRSIVIQSLVASEAAAKFAMVIEAWSGKSACRGLNTPFVQAMHRSWRSLRLATALGILLTISVFALEILGVVVALTASLMAATMVMISHRQFGGITGDVMGATNELTRLASLLVVLVAAKWV